MNQERIEQAWDAIDSDRMCTVDHYSRAVSWALATPSSRTAPITAHDAGESGIFWPYQIE